MSQEHETHSAGSAPTISDAPAAAGPPFEAMLARARRILSGDIRPEDYLPVTPEVEDLLRRDLAFVGDSIRKAHRAGRIPAPFEVDPSVPIRQRNEYLLAVHFGGQNIARIENETGVIVLAVGLEEGRALLGSFPYEMRKDVGFDAPQPLDTIGIY